MILEQRLSDNVACIMKKSNARITMSHISCKPIVYQGIKITLIYV